MIYPDFYPFYATQGSPGFYNEEREQEKEFDLMRSYYPDTARRIQEKAEAQCQLLDYEGSRLYDEYPDRFMLYHICHQVKGQMEGKLMGSFPSGAEFPRKTSTIACPPSVPGIHTHKTAFAF